MDFLDIPDEILAQRYPGQDIGLLKEAYRQAQAVKSGQAEKSAKPVTETIKTDPGTGEQTVTISGSPHDLSPANPLTPTVVSPVAPTAPVVSARPQMVAPQQPVQPVNPAEAYNQYTQQQESGANPNIGYHNPQQSTAYGAYGITQPQYQEIQKQNPQFAGRDITSLSPEEQAQANATSHDVYADQLKAKGVEPTEENIRLAHFLGAGGAHQFLNNGAISPQAAAANGGEDKARQIALARLNGPVNPNQAPPMIAGNASSDVGLTPTEQAVSQMNKKPSVDQVASDAIVAAGNNPTKLYALAGNENFPENFRNIARDMALQHDKFANKQKEVLGNFEDAANGNVTAATKMMKSLRSSGEEGSLTKAVLLGLIGARSLAKEEFQKYSGQYYKTSQAQLGNDNYTVQMDPKGAIVKAYDIKGNPVNDEKIAELNARGVPGVDKGQHFESGLIDINTDKGGYSRAIVNGREVVRDAEGNIVEDPTIKANLRKVGVEGTPKEQMDSAREKAAIANLKSRISNPTSEQIYQAYKNAGVSPQRIESVMGLAPGTLSKQGPVNPNQTPTRVENAPSNVAAANTAQNTESKPSIYEEPVQRQGEPDLQFKQRQKDHANKMKPLTKEAEGFRDKADGIKSQLDSIRRGIDIVKSGEYNLGPQLSLEGGGPLPGVQQAVGSLFGTQGSQNTNIIKSLITREGLQGIKNSMGPSISNFDVQSWLASNPIKENSTQAEMEKYLNKLYTTLYNHAERSRKNAEDLGYIDPGFDLGEKPTGKGGDTGIKIIKREKI